LRTTIGLLGYDKPIYVHRFLSQKFNTNLERVDITIVKSFQNFQGALCSMADPMWMKRGLDKDDSCS